MTILQALLNFLIICGSILVFLMGIVAFVDIREEKPNEIVNREFKAIAFTSSGVLFLLALLVVLI